jgi:PKHD-type hydroxylase
MLVVPAVLSAEDVARVRDAIDAADWIDGNATSGSQSALAKHNRQLPEESAAARAAGEIVLDALGRSPLFVASALPLKVYPPLFNCYGPGEAFDTHVDTAIRIRRGSDFRIRSDLSATLFLSDPQDYDGGELIVEDRPGVKLSAGDMLLYPASTLHRVAPVTRGARVASFFWVQSMIRSEADRAILFDLDTAIQSLTGTTGSDNPDLVRLTCVYHNLLRRWAEI